ncbi:NADH:ubiquinone reductase (Na(+)-transporting) subunit C [Pelagibacterium sp.]|uniref:NADH:ubiquinone reductase (Na(+)-transporting) subunit C n=1 Tax=Pelagibacterium sp. TaxID=1967288 RepID=UPI003A9217C0
MADLNPVALWRNLLALPNESRTKTLAVAFAVSTVCAVVVSGAAVILGPIQQANLAAEQAARMEEMLASMPEMAALIEEAGGDSLEKIVVDLRTGQIADDVDPETFDAAAARDDPETSTVLSAEEDIAGIGRRPDLVPIHVLREAGQLRLVILPISGAGYQSVIRANLALEGDLNTVAAFSVTEQGETPGLGARIEEPAWQALWPGKHLVGLEGDIRLDVVRGRATTEFEIDGITGATRTGNGITNAVHFWLGPNGFGPVLDNLARGEL